MAHFQVKLTVPANTPVTSPVRASVDVEGEVLSGMVKFIPYGVCGLAYYRVLYGLEQLYPKEPGTWDTGDGIVDYVPIGWIMPEHICEITVEGYNEDDTFEHAIYLLLETDTLAKVRLEQYVEEMYEMLKDFLGV
jgi:hypothetical protein